MKVDPGTNGRRSAGIVAGARGAVLLPATGAELITVFKVLISVSSDCS